MKLLKNTSALLLLSTLALATGCNGQQDFYEKEGMAGMSVGPSDTVINVITPPNIIPADPAPTPDPVAPNTDDVCVTDPKACDLTPVVTKAGVVTMLLAFGDLVNDQVVISEGSARLLAQNSVKYASPVTQPKILVVKDFNNQEESQYDTQYIATVLLSNYNDVSVLNETSAGLSASDLAGYDLIWFNNPGHAMGSRKTLATLLAFKGGVILSGDDLTQGEGFSLEALTGLKFIDNGASMSCDGRNYNYDNNGGERYQVEISNQFLPGIAANLRMFEYGNDIDNSAIANADSKLEVLASAHGICGGTRPVIVRYEK